MSLLHYAGLCCVSIVSKTAYAVLERMHLVREDGGRPLVKMSTVAMVGVGSTKLYLGVTRGRPVLFLVVLMVVSMVALFKVVRPFASTSRLGRTYLEACRDREAVQ